MSDGPNTIEVSLLGRTYRVACEDGERESLLQAVAYLDIDVPAADRSAQPS